VLCGFCDVAGLGAAAAGDEQELGGWLQFLDEWDEVPPGVGGGAPALAPDAALPIAAHSNGSSGGAGANGSGGLGSSGGDGGSAGTHGSGGTSGGASPAGGSAGNHANTSGSAMAGGGGHDPPAPPPGPQALDDTIIIGGREVWGEQRLLQVSTLCCVSCASTSLCIALLLSARHMPTKQAVCPCK
jgi:hypothetical protein